MCVNHCKAELQCHVMVYSIWVTSMMLLELVDVHHVWWWTAWCWYPHMMQVREDLSSSWQRQVCEKEDSYQEENLGSSLQRNPQGELAFKYMYITYKFLMRAGIPSLLSFSIPLHLTPFLPLSLSLASSAFFLFPPSCPLTFIHCMSAFLSAFVSTLHWSLFCVHPFFSAVLHCSHWVRITHSLVGSLGLQPARPKQVPRRGQPSSLLPWPIPAFMGVVLTDGQGKFCVGCHTSNSTWPLLALYV